jgi:hypothetical protein
MARISGAREIASSAARPIQARQRNLTLLLVPVLRSAIAVEHNWAGAFSTRLAHDPGAVIDFQPFRGAT